MALSGTDIPWATLRQVVQDWAGSHAELAEFRPLEGGSVNTTLLLTLGDQTKAVLKITPYRVDRAYADEAAQLALLQKVGMPVPEVYACFTGSLDRPYSYLLMSFVEGVDFQVARRQCTAEQFDRLQAKLAEVLLALHQTTGATFTRVSADNVPSFDTWAAWFHHSFDAIWSEVEKRNVVPTKLRKCINRTHDRLDRLLPCAGPPRLLHGDVWSTNLLARPDTAGDWQVAALLDPNCRFGCPEAELAYIDLFNTATPAFLKAYQRDRKLPSEYHQVRKPIYQLYSLLNHVHRFGGEYGKMLCAQAERVAAFV